MFIHQVGNSIGADIYNAFLYRDIVWSSHLHKAFEFVFVLQGSMTAVIGAGTEAEETVRLQEGLLIPPYRQHSYEDPQNCRSFVAVFSTGYVEDCARLFLEKDPDSHRLTPDAETCAYLVKNLMNGAPDVPDAQFAVPKPPAFALKSCLYAIFASFLTSRVMISRRKDASVTSDILRYLEEHFTEDLSLHTLSKALGYDYEYLSRVFNRTFGIHFRMLLNQYRCERAGNLIRSTDQPLATVAMNSGFQSIRTFNRVFREIMGVSPSDLRR